MISVASLLNPVNSELRSTLASSSPSSTYSARSSPYGSPLPSQPMVHKQRMAKDGAIFAKGKTKGDVNFPPFECLDENILREIEKYQVYPLGQIEEFPRHIPYNSDKKNFLEKTGRESFEVFQYEFKLPREDKTYTVMWDYNIGLVRITPFFKCCKYSKTTPAKMLNLNPGLKEITHSITGGALIAQGYWMPYSCALAVCATFCAHISHALIPIFGPTFPSTCIPTSHESYGTMIIDPSIIVSATTEAESFRLQYSTASQSPDLMKLDSASSSGRLRDVEHFGIRSPTGLSHRLRLKRPFNNTNLYNTDVETSDTSLSSRGHYGCSPTTPTSPYTISGWTAHNAYSTPTITLKRANLHTSPSPILAGSAPGNGHRITVSCGASPWLSAIPRSVADGDETAPANETLPMTTDVAPPVTRKSLRRAWDPDLDEEYDGEESASCSDQSGSGDGVAAVEKKAAWLLMNLSVRDGERAAVNPHPFRHGNDPAADHGPASTGPTLRMDSAGFRETLIGAASDGPRVKRRRAASL